MSSSGDETKRNHIHLLPCSIEFDGPAPVSSYFLTGDENGRAAHFRGRRLLKKDIHLPDGVVGMHMVIPDGRDGSERKAELQSAFKDFTVWQHDMLPSGQEVDQCLDWFEISEAVRFPRRLICYC